MSDFEDMSKDDLWVLVEENLIGTQNQCIALAEQLNHQYSLKNFILKDPWKTVSPFISFGIDMGIVPKVSSPFPKILIAAGRKSIAPALWIKKVSGGKTFTIFIMDPKHKRNDFDLIIAPAHDQFRGDNVISTLGSLNNISDAILKEEVVKFNRLEKLSSPKVAILIGGKSKTHDFTDQNLDHIIRSLKQLHNQYDASFMVTCSRRTPEPYIKKIKQGLSDMPHDFWDGTGPNPFKAYLGAADYILVTNDSVSMISEAASTGKPVYLLPLSGSSPKFDRFYKELLDVNAVRMFEGTLENWGPTRLNEGQRVADIVKERYLNKHKK